MNSEDKMHWPLGPFNDSTDAQDLRREWEEWHRSFELLLELKHIESQREKCVLMLTLGGRGLQRIFHNLAVVPEEIYPRPVKVPLCPAEIPEYDNAVKRLEKFFVGKRNERVELELFRSLKQTCDESFNNFILKLRTQARRCAFKDREEKEILQQITMGARDERVRDKGLENIMNLDELTSYAINREILTKQKEKSKAFNDFPVAAVEQQWLRRTNGEPTNRKFVDRESRNFGFRRQQNRRLESECDRCGSRAHLEDSRNCPARASKCNRCGRDGHFARKCRNRKTVNARYTWKRPAEETNCVRTQKVWNEELPHRPTRDDISEVE
ncbi:uncharacterized protein LOC131437828 [Malaya genurostris]|uniref:uncharacterized protein LOC131437828 n=1 Tax=Malaya genurostris TaxID=325434 RepID=UPI0026F3E37B|nr:uncharacterized protein LOC131437828 [Malaya genurostris]